MPRAGVRTVEYKFGDLLKSIDDPEYLLIFVCEREDGYYSAKGAVPIWGLIVAAPTEDEYWQGGKLHPTHDTAWERV